MTIASDVSRNNYLGTGLVATYSYTFKVFSYSDLLVTVADLSDDETTLVYNTDFTATGLGEDGGGTITLAVNLANNFKLTIRRVVDVIQETDIKNLGAFYPETHEDQFDKLVMIDQQQEDAIARSITFAETVDPSDFDTTLPASLVGEASVTIITNATGDGFEVGPSAGAISGAQANAAAAAADAAAAAASAASAAASASAAALAVTAFLGTSGGAANAQTLTPVTPLSSYAEGQRFFFKAGFTNSAAMTINISGLGVKDVRSQSGTALAANAVVTGRIYTITYDGTLFVLQELSTPEDLSVTAAKIATDAVTTNKILNTNVTLVKLATDVTNAYGRSYFYGKISDEFNRGGGTGFGDFTTMPTSTLTTVLSSGLGTVAQAGTAGNFLPGIIFTPDIAGIYRVTATTNAVHGSTGNLGLKLVDGSGTDITGALQWDQDGGNQSSVVTLTALVTGVAAAAQTVKFYGRANVTGIVLNDSGYSAVTEFTVERIA